MTSAAPASQRHDLRRALRPPDQVLKLERMGSFHQTRLSFMRVLLRHMVRHKWQTARTLWEIDRNGCGTAVYEVRGEGRAYSLIAFSQELDPAKRTDRVIAEEWDATFALHDGVPTSRDIARLSRNIPLQEAGRCSSSELVMARANRSVRLFDHVVARLSQGRQPEAEDLDAVGYLMRTTAVYGNGKFGLADRERLAERSGLCGPFAAEMLTVWLIRAFTTDLVEHLAHLRSPATAVSFDRDLRRRLGVGNSTGLGMAPFVVNHPGLFHRWIHARETALGRVLSLEYAGEEELGVFRDRLRRARHQTSMWQVDDGAQRGCVEQLRSGLDRLAQKVATTDAAAPFYWARIFDFAERELGVEAQEMLVTLLLEPHGTLVDDLADTMGGEDPADFTVDGAAKLQDLKTQIEANYAFVSDIDFGNSEAQARFWYISEEKLEPRLGERFEEEGAERELPLAIARDVALLRQALLRQPEDLTVAAFLAQYPQFRHAVRRIQLTTRSPYAEIRENLTGGQMRPLDILRCKLSFFGATDFDPRSDRWLRVALYRHAPFPDELHAIEADDWAIPPLERAAKLISAEPRIEASAGAAARQLPREGYSLNEIDAEVRKAARGAGLSWGLADDAGRLGRSLAAHVPEFLGLLAAALEEVKEGRHAVSVTSGRSGIRSASDELVSPLVLAPAIADRNDDVVGGVLPVRSWVALPCLLIPPLAILAGRLRRPLELRMDAAQVTVGSDWTAAFAQLTSAARTRTVAVRALPGSQWREPLLQPVAGPAVITDPLWRRLNQLARLTYVPASEHSRRKGAGGAVDDND